MRVVTIDDHALFRRCMSDYLNDIEDMEVVGEASSGEAGLDLVDTLQPDIALVDYDLGGHDGIALTQQIMERCPSCSVVILTGSEDENQMRRALGLGAKGYILKDIEPDKLVTKLRRISAGEMAFPQSFLINQAKNSVRPPQDEETLTPREIEVLQLVTDGLIDRSVASQLEISENTVRNHMKSVRRKLGVTNRLQATLIGLKKGIVQKPGLPLSSKLGGSTR